jgi:heterodisulfide reductase subunit A
VYVCHCGTNIAGVVDVVKVAEYAGTLPDVAVAREYKFMCSDPGQELIRKDIRESGLNRVIVAACSPRMHEPTFRRTVDSEGLNPYLFQMANIRENCSWVHDDRDEATKKAQQLVRAALFKARNLEPLETKMVDVKPSVVVVGGGIAGITAALSIADGGIKVYLVEKDPSIGGKMINLDKTFPTLDCSACILTPKMVSAGQHENIELLTYSEVEDVSGHIGNFKLTVRKKARYVNPDRCNGCGLCMTLCPAISIPKKRKIMIGDREIARFVE